MSETFAPQPKSASGKVLPFRGYKLAEVLPVLQRIAADQFSDWTWCRNMHCKYITVMIDTRDGGYVRLRDRDGLDITIDELAVQYGADKENK